MMEKKADPAEIFVIENEQMRAAISGDVTGQRIELTERAANFPVGSLLIETGLVQGGQVKVRALASNQYRMLYYEIHGSDPIFRFCLRLQPQRETDYINYNIGGLYFECEAPEAVRPDGGTGILLIGKAAIHTDGFPKAGEDGLRIQNASRLAVYMLVETNNGEPQDAGDGSKPDIADACGGNAEGADAFGSGTGEPACGDSAEGADAFGSGTEEPACGDSPEAAAPESTRAILNELTGGMEAGRFALILRMQMAMNRRFASFEELPVEQLSDGDDAACLL